MFKSIDIENFRGIKKLHVGGLGRVNLLVGKNGSGKTTVLESLTLISAPTYPLVSHTINSNRLIQLGKTGLDLLFHQQQTDSLIKLSAEFSSGRAKRDLTIRTYTEPIPSLPIEQLKGDDLDEFNRVVLDWVFNHEDGHPYKSKMILESGNVTVERDKEYVGEEFASYYIPSGISDLRNNLFLSAFDDLLRDKKEAYLIRALSQIEPSLISLDRIGDTIYADVGLSKRIPISVMGDGIWRTLVVMLALSKTAGAIVLIDEIDSGLHYSALEVMCKAVFAAAKEFNVQVFATTHSQECITAFAKTDGLEEGEMKLFRITKTGEEHFATEYTRDLLQVVVEDAGEVRGH